MEEERKLNRIPLARRGLERIPFARRYLESKLEGLRVAPELCEEIKSVNSLTTDSTDKTDVDHERKRDNLLNLCNLWLKKRPRIFRI